MSIIGDINVFASKTQIEETANDSDKTFTVPANKLWVVQGIWILYASSADVGNRYVRILLTDSADKTYWLSAAAQAHAASLSRNYHATPGQGVRGTSGAEVMPLPNPCVLPAGWKIRVYDSAAIAAAADDMTVALFYAEIDML